MADRRITLDVSDDAKHVLADKGYDPDFGARPLKRLIQREIADRAAVLILEGKAGEDSTIHVTARDGELLVSV
jgi:ATP-dependent Clp protease ATP-binding subunit ClpB